MARRREEGLALVLVMTVVLALAVVATPFVLSMLLQERSGTVSRYVSQAHYAAEGAKNYALWRLMLSVDHVERRYGSGLNSSYFYDTRREFDVRLDDQYLSQNQVRIADPKGSIWGLTIQDEQGKINVRTAPTQVLASLAAAVDGRQGTFPAMLGTGVADLKDYLTMHSGRDATWIAPQRIRPVGHETGAGSGGVTVDNLHLLGRGSRVRVSKPGMRPLITEVTGNSIIAPTGQDGFSTRESIAGYLWGVIEVEQRHPLNLNTARRETLVAAFEGLNIFGMPNSVMTRDAAMQLATRFAGRDTDRLETFLQALAGSPISGPQKLAVALNAVCPSAALLNGSGTVPVGFKSYDVHSIEAFASMNTPAGTEAAGRGFREIVSVSPPAPLQRACESQYDFVQMYGNLRIAMQAIRPNLAFDGYPYGNRMVTFPNPPTMMADTALRGRQAAGQEAYLTVVPAEDHRGRSLRFNAVPWENELTGWADRTFARDRYENEIDGKKLSGMETAPWTKYFCLNHRTQGGAAVPAPVNQRPDIGKGGVEFWAKFDASPSGQTLFDIREADTMNRLTLRVEGTELILTLCDGTMGLPHQIADNGSAEVRQYFAPPPDTWVHIGAYWKGTRMGQLALLVDGFAHPQQTFQHKSPEGQDLLGKLGGALDATSTTFSVNPNPHSGATAFLVGAEVILHDPGASTNPVIRGARGTTAVPHLPQVPVSVWGYTSRLRNDSYRAEITPNFSRTIRCTRLPRTDARLSYSFGPNPQAVVAGDKQDPTTMQWQIDAAQTDIGVTTANIMDFPDQGYVRIQGEVVFYTGRSNGGVGGPMGGNAKFTGCQRGQHGTLPAVHNTGANVSMWAVPVTSLAGFEDEAILQAGDEWFGPVRKDPLRPQFWISYIDPTNNRPLRLLRGLEVFGSLPNGHSAGDPVLPTFLSEALEDWPPNIQPMGRGDAITLTDATNQRELARVHNTNPAFPPGVRTWPDPSQFPNQWPKYHLRGNHQLAALDNPTTRDYVADDLHVRALKFPSGESLSRTWLEPANPQVSVGGWSGHIDEQKAFAMSKRLYHLNGALDAGANTLQLTQQGGFFERGGLIKIGNEYIGYGQAQAGSVSVLKRGWLASTPEVHDQGDPVFYLPWVPVSGLQSDVSPTDRMLYLSQSLTGDLQKYTRGLVLLDDELVMVDWMDPRAGNPWDAKTYTMPPTFDGQGGLYRGRFGTAPAAHPASRSLAYGMPWRYPDTWRPREFDNTMAYFQWSTKLELAQWHNLRWLVELPQGEQNIVVHTFARMDGQGEFWDSPAMSDMVALAESTAPGGPLNLKYVGHRNQAGQLDVRFYIEYRQNAFDPRAPWQAHSWKRVPKFKEIRVDYDRPTQVLFHEDR